MRELEDRLHDVDLITPPDVWGQALRREPSTQGLRRSVDTGPHGDVSPSNGRGRRAVAATMAIVVFIAAAWFAFGLWREHKAVPGDPVAESVLRLECQPNGAVRVLSPVVAAQPDGVHVAVSFPQEGLWELAVTGWAPAVMGQPSSIFDQQPGEETTETVLSEVAPGAQQVACYRSDQGTIIWASDVVPNMRPFEVVDPRHLYLPAELSCPADDQVKEDPRKLWRDTWPDVPTAQTLPGVLPTDVVELAGYPGAEQTWPWVRIVRDGAVIAAVRTRNGRAAMDVVACAGSGVLGA